MTKKAIVNVLLIDDDPDDAALFREAINELYPEALCKTVSTCENIRECFEKAPVDIIFLDGHLYPVDCESCIKNIFEIVDRTRTKVIIYSGSLSPKETNLLQHSGADQILAKATNYSSMKSTIGKIMENHLATL